MLKNEEGVTLLEELMAVALIVLALTIFVTGLSVAGSGVGTVYKRVSSENLARAGLEHIKTADFITVTVTGPGPYDLDEVPIVAPGYSITVTTQPLTDTLQLITVTVWSGSEVAFVMEEYKRGP